MALLNVRLMRRVVKAWLLLLLCCSLCHAFSFSPRIVHTKRVKVNSARLHQSATTTPRLPTTDNELEECPPGYYLDSVHKNCNPLGPLGKVSQKVELTGPFQRVYRKITTLFGVEPKKLGVAFALSYSVISNINGSISLSVAWYMSCAQTGLSPLAPGQWKSLLKAYGTIYALVQLLRPFRVAAAVAMSKLSNSFLEETQVQLNCSRGVAIVVQYALGWVAWAVVATSGIALASWCSGVPVWSGCEW